MNDFDPIIKAVTIPGRAGTFYVGEFSQQEAEEYRQLMIARDEANPDAAAREKALAVKVSDFILARSICDAAGTRLFTGEEGLQKLRAMPARIASPLFLAATHLNLLFGAGEAEVKQAEDFFMRAQGRNSGPISPGTSANPTSNDSNVDSVQPGSSTGSPT